MSEKPTYEELEQRIQELRKAESEHKQIDEVMRAREFLFLQMFEQSTTSTCLYNPDGTISRVNNQFCEMFGVEEKVIIDTGYNVFKDQAAIDAGVIPLLRDIFDEKKTKNWEINFDIDVASVSTGTPATRAGKIFLEVFGYPVLNRKGNLEYVVLQHYDITERKRVEAALLESKKKILNYSNQTEQLSLAAASMISIQDEQKIFYNISKAIVEHSDFSRVIISLFKDKAPFRDIIGFGGLDNDTIERLRKIDMPKRWYNGVFKKGKKIRRLSYYIPHNKKHILNQEATVFGEGPPPVSGNAWHPKDNLFVRMNDNKGKFIGVISVDESKSGLKPSGEIVRPLEVFSSLISQIIMLNRTHRKQKTLEEQLKHAHKMESIGTLTGGIAHDFNNILYMITGNAELAIEDIPEWNPVHDNLKEIKAAGLRAAGIVKQLLNFSRRTDQDHRPIGAITVIKDVLKFLRSTIPATIEIRQHLPDTDITILSDPIQINQVLMNLCTNASQVMERTGGILEIMAESVNLDEDAVAGYPELNAGDYLKIMVSDTGSGIDPEIADRIFDPYFTTKEVGKGSGMGLAVVHGIVKNHNGAIAVDSKPGKGSTFTILFPVVDEKPVMEVKTPDEKPRGNETILFVDDEESIVTMAQQLLERLGYKVEAKITPVEALELFESKPDQFDLVITDMTMPQMTGVKLSEKMKDIRSDIPVIICTGHSSLIDEDQAKKLGIAACVMKPIGMRDIAKTIRKVLDSGLGK